MPYSLRGQPDFEGARQHALMLLEHKLPPTLFYHSLAHTRDDVAPAAERLAASECVIGEALLLLRTAAYFHDVGFVVQRLNHEAIGAQMAAHVLPRFGYGQAHIQIITDLIMITKLPQMPHTRLERIIADADLDVLGREDFLVRNQALRDELAASGVSTADEAWYSSQLQFLQTHHYFTASARSTRDAQKQENIAALTRLLTWARVQQHRGHPAVASLPADGWLA